MKMHSAIASLFLAAGACAGPDAFDDDDVSAIAGALWEMGAVDPETPEWDSGITTNLSSWAYVRCDTLHNSNYLVTRLQGYPDKGSLDNYLARLEVQCGEYQNYGFESTGFWFRQNGTYAEHLLVSSSYDDPQGDSLLYSTSGYAAGIKLRVNVNNYVKDMELLRVMDQGGWLGDYGTPGEGWWITNFSGTEVELLCPDQTVMIGISARTSTGNGKIRRIRVHCRALTDV
jgi:hypothetical protein